MGNGWFRSSSIQTTQRRIPVADRKQESKPMSEEQETEPLEIGLGSYVGLRKGATLMTGMVNGIKLADGILEKISLEEVDMWFYMDAGWGFMQIDGSEDAEV